MRFPFLVILTIVLNAFAISGVIPPQVRKCVVFVFVQDTNGILKPQGTAFFVGVRSKADSTSFGYFVTAKHVLKSEESDRFFSRVFVRINKRVGTSDTLALDLFDRGKPIFHVHSDPTVDIAVIPAAPDLTVYDYMFIDEEMITTRELFSKENIQAGDDVFFTGLFARHYGKSVNLPIVRFGKVALISEEKVLWFGKLTDLYLIETTSFGGNSGSPLFFNFEPTRMPGVIVMGGPKLLLAGIVIGYFPVAAAPDWIETKQKVLWAFENSGIAAIVPAYHLHDILYKPELQDLRRRK